MANQHQVCCCSAFKHLSQANVSRLSQNEFIVNFVCTVASKTEGSALEPDVETPLSSLTGSRLSSATLENINVKLIAYIKQWCQAKEFTLGSLPCCSCLFFLPVLFIVQFPDLLVFPILDQEHRI